MYKEANNPTNVGLLLSTGKIQKKGNITYDQVKHAFQ